MNKRQRAAIENGMEELTDALLADVFLLYLVKKKIISKVEMRMLRQSGGSDSMTLLVTFDKLMHKSGGWECLMEFLAEHHYGQIAENLENWVSDEQSDESECEEPVSPQNYVADKDPSSENMIQTISGLSNPHNEEPVILAPDEPNQSKSQQFDSRSSVAKEKSGTGATQYAWLLASSAIRKLLDLVGYSPARPKINLSHNFWDSETSSEKRRRKAQLKLGIDTVNDYNFAVCGRTGTGKSSLINAMRSMVDKTFVPAQVGEEETTEAITAYPILAQPRVVLWDCPGGGTMRNPTRNYFERNCLYAFDRLIFLIGDCLCDFELTVARQATQHKVPIVYVRTKADKYVESKMCNGMSDFDAKAKLRAATEDKFLPDLPKAAQETPRLFIVSSEAFNNPRMIQHDEQKLLRFVLKDAMERRSDHSFAIVNTPIRPREFGQFNVGFIGADMVGKSLLIRSIMSLAPSDNEGPPVAEFGSDLPWQTYQIPGNPAMILHEIPYEDRQIGDIRRLQVVCVVIADQIIANDIMMIKYLHEAAIHFVLIRTKADQLIDRILHDRPTLCKSEAKEVAKSELMELLYGWDIGLLVNWDNYVLIVSAKAFTEGNTEFMDETKLYPKIMSFFHADCGQL